MTPRETTNGRSGAVGKTKVRTTITPGEVIEVDDAELTDLDRSGIIYASEDGRGKHKWVDEAKPSKADDDKKEG